MSGCKFTDNIILKTVFYGCFDDINGEFDIADKKFDFCFKKLIKILMVIWNLRL